MCISRRYRDTQNPLPRERYTEEQRAANGLLQMPFSPQHQLCLRIYVNASSPMLACSYWRLPTNSSV